MRWLSSRGAGGAACVRARARRAEGGPLAAAAPVRRPSSRPAGCSRRPPCLHACPPGPARRHPAARAAGCRLCSLAGSSFRPPLPASPHPPADIPELRPLGDRELVRVQESADVTMGGVILPDSAKERPLRCAFECGEVISASVPFWGASGAAPSCPTPPRSGRSGARRVADSGVWWRLLACAGRSEGRWLCAAARVRSRRPPDGPSPSPPLPRGAGTAAAAPWCAWAPASRTARAGARRPRSRRATASSTSSAPAVAGLVGGCGCPGGGRWTGRAGVSRHRAAKD